MFLKDKAVFRDSSVAQRKSRRSGGAFQKGRGVVEVTMTKVGAGDMRTVFHKMGFGKAAQASVKLPNRLVNQQKPSLNSGGEKGRWSKRTTPCLS